MKNEFKTQVIRPDSRIDHFWYDARRTLACNIYQGQTCVLLRVKRDEVESMIHQLENHGKDPVSGVVADSLDRPRATCGWWDYDGIDDDGNAALCLYRDDCFHIELPHEVGVALLAVLKDRIPEMEESSLAVAR